MFQVFDDGVLQDIDSFAAINLPRTPIRRQDAVEVPIVRADAASNIRESADQSTDADQPLRSSVPIYPIDPRGLTH